MCLFVITYRLWTIYFYCISLISLHTKTFVLPSHTRELTIVQLPSNLILFWLSPVRFLIGDRVLRFILHKKHNRTSNLPVCYISNISIFLYIFFIFTGNKMNDVTSKKNGCVLGGVGFGGDILIKTRQPFLSWLYRLSVEHIVRAAAKS